ncbi:MAG: site-specific DNA-methyltransferase [Deltaproteobacteria bacterium]|nr:site-specific DNA-methyltransferase [Deltaproteobacteria bacterium]
MSNEPKKLSLESASITDEQQQKLKSLFPEIFTEGGKIDFDRLKLTLGELVDIGKERYSLNWPGKAECFKTIQKPSTATLKPTPKESVNFDVSENLIIEGDNLEVLKLLQKSYHNKIKMIYIDPPYNTGNDFIYPDNYTETLETYLRYTGQIDAEGRKFSNNTDTDGRFHSKWLNMMYPRLFLARNLLRDDGVIFISIDDHEVSNLRKVCDEVFGAESFVANVVWEKKYTRSNDATFFSDNHDHILVYTKRKDLFKLNLLPRSKEQESAYSNPDNHTKGPWKATPLHAKSGNMTDFTYTFRNGLTWRPPSGTFPRFSKETLLELEINNEIWFGSNGDSAPSRKSFLSEVKAGVTPVTIWPYSEAGHNHEANSELKVLELAGLFDNPKPTRLVQRMLQLVSPPTHKELPSDMILDFFAGSGTTAHAVLDLNKQDSGNRKFILVQLPEPCDEKSEAYKAGFKSIADITKERVRRVIKKLNDEDAGKLDLDGSKHQNRGFKVFKLTPSNFKIWDGDKISKDPKKIASTLDLFVEHIDPKAKPADIFYELLLKSGFSLTSKVKELKLAGKQVYSVEDNTLLICLDKNLTKDAIKEMANLQPARVVCLDAGFPQNDQLKTNAVQIMKSKKIEFRTV